MGERKHTVKASMMSLELSKAGSGISLSIDCNDERLGTIKIGHGSIMWRSASKKTFKRIDWTKFARIMSEM